jgi:hypothetical protein
MYSKAEGDKAGISETMEPVLNHGMSSRELLPHWEVTARLGGFQAKSPNREVFKLNRPIERFSRILYEDGRSGYIPGFRGPKAGTGVASTD